MSPVPPAAPHGVAGAHQLRWSGLSTLYFDCFSGAAGDMILGALIDAGLPLAELRRALGSLAVEEGTIWTERVVRAGLEATKFCVRGEDPEPSARGTEHAHPHVHTHGHDHAHPHETGGSGMDAHRHRTLAEIAALVDGSALSPTAKARTHALFSRLAEAEAAIHGTSIDEVHLHEVGALDSIIDITGTVFGLEWLGIDQVVASPLNVGSGTVHAAHGSYPVPAPATLRLLEGAPIYAGPQGRELVTPTGALLVTGYASSYGPVPAMRVRHVGYGAGTRDFAGRPNVLRVVIGDADAPRATHTVVVLEAEIDDMNPQLFGVVMDGLLADGALDVYYTPVQMKKNRPGTLLTVIAHPRDRARLTARIFRETTTIGVRYREMERECLDREIVRVDTPLGTVGVKVARRDGAVLNAAPEFDDCVRVAAHTGRPVKEVQAAAMKAFLDRPREF